MNSINYNNTSTTVSFTRNSGNKKINITMSNFVNLKSKDWLILLLKDSPFIETSN